MVKCGRPGTGMPFHDQFAYTDKRCYGVTRAELGKDVPPLGESLQPREIDAVVKYLFAKAVGRGRRPTRTASNSGARTRASASR